MDWETVRRLAGEGMEFGGHSRTHADLTRLDPAACEGEIAGCAADLSERIGSSVIALQLPMAGFHPLSSKQFGGITALHSGPELAIVRREDDPADLPRIEMHSFRDPPGMEPVS